MNPTANQRQDEPAEPRTVGHLRKLAVLHELAGEDAGRQTCNWAANLIEDTADSRRILDDIRQHLKGLPESRLDGEHGLAAATMRKADWADELAEAVRETAELLAEFQKKLRKALKARAD